MSEIKRPQIEPNYHDCRVKYGINWTPELINRIVKALNKINNLKKT